MTVTRFEGTDPVARYWLANCEGFAVEGAARGVVEELQRDDDPHVTARLVVRTRGGRRKIVQAASIASVVPADRVLVVERERRPRPQLPDVRIPVAGTAAALGAGARAVAKPLAAARPPARCAARRRRGARGARGARGRRRRALARPLRGGAPGDYRSPMAVTPESRVWEALFAERTRAGAGDGIAAILGLLANPDLISFAGGFPDPLTFPARTRRAAARRARRRRRRVCVPVRADARARGHARRARCAARVAAGLPAGRRRAARHERRHRGARARHEVVPRPR